MIASVTGLVVLAILPKISPPVNFHLLSRHAQNSTLNWETEMALLLLPGIQTGNLPHKALHASPEQKPVSRGGRGTEIREIRRADFIEVIRTLELKSLSYFLENTHPQTGLVRDRARNFGKTPNSGKYRIASLAATGFGMAVLANAAARGLISRETAQRSILKTLRFATRLDHHKGWLYHFVDWETGRRTNHGEVSTIDTSIFIAGALYAASVFPESEISRLSQTLYHRLDFQDMMTDGGAKPTKRTLSMGWMPETGYLKPNWASYSELILLLLLGLGHPLKPLPKEVWDAWARPKTKTGSGQEVMGGDLPLFAHQYSHLFVDLRGRADRWGNYFENSVLATRHNREVCARSPYHLTYRQGFWGLSASGSPKGYRAFSPGEHDGTVCPGAAAASVMFLPDLVLSDLNQWMRGSYRSQIMGKYGFVDSLNLARAWFDPDVLGITVGAVYLALANLDKKESIWSRFNGIPAVQEGLRRAYCASDLRA